MAQARRISSGAMTTDCIGTYPMMGDIMDGEGDGREGGTCVW